MKKLIFHIKKFIYEKLYDFDFINSISIDYVDLVVRKTK